MIKKFSDFMMSALGFFFAWLLWSIVFAGIMQTVELLTGYDWQKQAKSRTEKLLEWVAYIGGFALFIKLLG